MVNYDFDYIDADYWTCPFCQRWLPPDIDHECDEEKEFIEELSNGA